MLHPQLQASNLQLQQQAMHPEKAQTEQTAVSDAAKGDADKQDWSAQLRAACHTLGLEHVTDLDAAKDEMTRALVYLRSIEHSLRGLKRQTEAVTGMPNMLLLNHFAVWSIHRHTLHICCCCFTAGAHSKEPSVIMMHGYLIADIYIDETPASTCACRLAWPRVVSAQGTKIHSVRH